MRKILLTAFVTVLSTAFAMAQSVAGKAEGNYAGQLFVNVAGVVSDDTPAADGTYVVKINPKSANTITFTLANFGFMGAPLGDIVLDDIPVTVEGQNVHFGQNPAKKLVFHLESNGQQDSIVATAKVNAEKSVIKGDSATVFVDVVWILPLNGGEQPIGVKFEGIKIGNYQIPNAGFEKWNTDNEPSTGWHSFGTAKGGYSNYKGMSAANTNKTAGYESSTAALLKSRWVGFLFIGANANGNVTTGCINMGSSTPASADNYNYTDREGENHLTFVGLPDSVTCFAKFKRGKAAKGTSADYNAQIHAIIHGDIDYKDPHETAENEKAFKVADALVSIAPAEDWTRCSAPLTYTDVQADKRYALVSITTNPLPGGSTEDELTVDNVMFVYNSSLAKVTYKGEEVAIPAANDTTQINEVYNGDNFIAITNAHAATIEKAYDEDSKVLTVTVKGNDILLNPTNFHTYKFHIDAKATGIETPVTFNDKTTTYDLQGRHVKRAERGVYIVDGKKVIK